MKPSYRSAAALGLLLVPQLAAAQTPGATPAVAPAAQAAATPSAAPEALPPTSPDATPPPVPMPAPMDAAAPPRFRWAAGLSLGAFPQPDGTWGLAPELVAYRYLALAAPWGLRAGARLGLRGVDQSQLAGQIGITERDAIAAAEAAVTYNWYVVPALAIGASYTHRWLALTNRSEIDTSGAVATPSSTSHLGVYVQASLGLPLLAGKLVLEPYYRYEFVDGDPRLGPRFGLEATWGW